MLMKYDGAIRITTTTTTNQKHDHHRQEHHLHKRLADRAEDLVEHGASSGSSRRGRRVPGLGSPDLAQQAHRAHIPLQLTRINKKQDEGFTNEQCVSARA